VNTNEKITSRAKTILIDFFTSSDFVLYPTTIKYAIKNGKKSQRSMLHDSKTITWKKSIRKVGRAHNVFRLNENDLNNKKEVNMAKKPPK
jgi:hypothetical protein